MMKARDRVLKTRWVGVDELTPAPFHADLFPLPRDLSGLRRSFDRHGYRAEYPLVVRARRGSAGGFEIVCGVGRHAVARERGMRRVPVVARSFESDERARAYAIEDNLFNAPASSRPALAHMIVLAGALKECGGECAPRQVWEAAGVSPSTYWRAEGSLVRSLGRILASHPELEGLDFLRQVAEIIRKDLDPQLTRLISGGVEINTYHKAHGQRAGTTRRVNVGAGRSRKGGRAQAAPAVPSGSSKMSGEVSQAAKVPRRQKAAKKDSNLPLLDLLSSLKTP
jgi:hypothetical protein